jgi:hypothetical protein
MTLLYQLLCILPVEWFALTLAVGAKVAGFKGAFIRCEAGPFQAFKNIFFGARHITALIGILYAEYKITAMLAGKQVIV